MMIKQQQDFLCFGFMLCKWDFNLMPRMQLTSTATEDLSVLYCQTKVEHVTIHLYYVACMMQICWSLNFNLNLDTTPLVWNIFNM